MKKQPYDYLLSPRTRADDARAFDEMCARHRHVRQTRPLRAPLLRLVPSPGALEAARDDASRDPFALEAIG